ncbi:MAG: hypothetical protein ACREPG_03470, partial [Candidatus Binatia bacterium]
MKIPVRVSWTLSLLMLHLAACAGEKLIEPAPRAAAPAPVAPRPAPTTGLPDYRGPATRPFLMGFTHWPADLTDEGVALARDYAQARGDIVAINFIGGIPWPEAFDGKPFSKNVQESMNHRTAPEKKLFLSISPLNKDRRDLAPYWGDAENQPLPKGWDKEPLNSARVKRAYLNFVLRAVDT